MYDENEYKKEITSQLRTFTVWAASSLMDGFFLVIWVLIQWLVNYFISKIELSNVDQWVLGVFQIIFSVTTLAPILIYVYLDIRVMVIRARRKIQAENEGTNND